MILVTVGMHTAPFDRLVRAADAYAATADEEIVIQRGVSRCVPGAARSFTFCDSAELHRLMQASRVVVSHGADTVLDALRIGRPVVVVPRQRTFGEHLDDHQVAFGRALARRGWVQLLDDLTALGPAIESAARMSLPSVPDQPRLALMIRGQLDQWFPAVAEGEPPHGRVG